MTASETRDTAFQDCACRLERAVDELAAANAALHPDDNQTASPARWRWIAAIVAVADAWGEFDAHCQSPADEGSPSLRN